MISLHAARGNHQRTLFFALATIALCACGTRGATTGTAPSVSASTIAVPLLPLTTLLAPATNVAPQVSPDGKWISFLRPVDDAMNLWIAPADSIGTARAITHHQGRGLQPL